MSLSLEDLDEDLVFKIVHHLAVDELASFSSTCTAFRKLCFSAVLWNALILRDFEQYPDCPPPPPAAPLLVGTVADAPHFNLSMNGDVRPPVKPTIDDHVKLQINYHRSMRKLTTLTQVTWRRRCDGRCAFGGREGHAAAVTGDPSDKASHQWMLVVGGFGRAGISLDVHALGLAGPTRTHWRRLPASFDDQSDHMSEMYYTGRYGHSCTAICPRGTRLLVFGGVTQGGYHGESDMAAILHVAHPAMDPPRPARPGGRAVFGSPLWPPRPLADFAPGGPMHPQPPAGREGGGRRIGLQQLMQLLVQQGIPEERLRHTDVMEMLFMQMADNDDDDEMAEDNDDDDDDDDVELREDDDDDAEVEDPHDDDDDDDDDDYDSVPDEPQVEAHPITDEDDKLNDDDDDDADGGPAAIALGAAAEGQGGTGYSPSRDFESVDLTNPAPAPGAGATPAADGTAAAALAAATDIDPGTGGGATAQANSDAENGEAAAETGAPAVDAADLHADDDEDTAPAVRDPVDGDWPEVRWEPIEQRRPIYQPPRHRRFAGRDDDDDDDDDASAAERGKRASAPFHPMARGYHSACYSAAHGVCVIFGGIHRSRPIADLAVLDVHSLQWSQPQTTGSPPCARFGHSATLVGSKMVVVGGAVNGGDLLRDGQDLVGSVHVLDLDTWHWTEPETNADTVIGGRKLPTGRCHMAQAIGHKVVLTGGSDVTNRTVQTNSVMALDTDTWMFHAPEVRLDDCGPQWPDGELTPRFSHTMVVAGCAQRLVLAGGWSARRTIDELTVLDVL